MNKLSILPLVLGPMICIAATVAHGQQSARIVHYHQNDIVSIRARMHYTTLIELPSSEKIMEVATGDKDFWIIDAVDNYCFLHPAKAGIESDLDLITNKGNVYSFVLRDDETEEPDLKVVIDPSDPSSLATVNAPAKWVPAKEVTTVEAGAATLRRRDANVVEEFRANYPVRQLKFDYRYKNKAPFDVTAIYHDDRFTYIRTTAPEKFAVYAVKDGKPDLINFQLRDNTYVIPQVLDKGYLQIGKHKLVFERKEKH
jgi:type IV secretion system protein VirB9